MLSKMLSGRAVNKRSWAELNSFFQATAGYTSENKNTIASQINEYRSWVMAACNIIHRRVSEIDYKLFRTDLQEEIKPRHAIYKTVNRIFQDPNEFHEFRFLKSWIQLSLDLCGMAFILREDDALGLPYKLWPLNIANFHKIEKGETFREWIKGFTFRVNGESVTYKPDNILYFHYVSPFDARDGFSPIKAQAYAVDIDHYIEVFERSFFQNSARPDIMLKYPENVEIESEDAEKIIEQWRKKFRGPNKSHSIAIIDKGASLEKLTPMNADLALSWLAQWSQDKILSAFAVPKGKIGIMVDLNKANSQSIEETFNGQCILPRLRLMDEVFTRGVLQKFDERIAMVHSNPIPRDQAVMIEEAKVKCGVGTRTINEQREIDGQKSIGPEGDKIFIPLNFIALGASPGAGRENEDE